MLASLACAPRRFACRYWAGRVALRENRAPTHRLTAPRRSEAARPKINLLKVARLARAGCRAVRTAHSWRGIVPFTPTSRTSAPAAHGLRAAGYDQAKKKKRSRNVSSVAGG